VTENEIILNGALSGESRVIDFLYDKYALQLRYFAYKYLNSNSEVDDILQEAFVGLWENRKRIVSELMAKGFLYKYIRNEAVTRLRKRDVKKRFEKFHNFEESEESFLGNLIEAEVLHNLSQAISSLPDSCRTICLMSLKGMKLQEISEKLNISVNTVKKQKSISNARIRKIMEELFLFLISI